MRSWAALFASAFLLVACGGSDSIERDLIGEWAAPPSATAEAFVYPGIEHCETQDLAELQIHNLTTDGRTYYLRDPGDEMRKFLSHVPVEHSREIEALPPEARDTGFARDDAALWLAADESAAYLVSEDTIERWPRWEFSLTYCD